MPAPERRTPRSYKSAEYYLDRIHVFHPDEQRLKTQMLAIFRHCEEHKVLLDRIRTELNDGLLVSKEVVFNPKEYQYFCKAFECRKVRVKANVINKWSCSFVAKLIIAAIWLEDEEKVKRGTLLLEYHNVSQLVVNSNKDILSEQEDESTGLETDPQSSSSSWQSPEEINGARRTLDCMKTEDQRAITVRALGNESPDDEMSELEPGRDEYELKLLNLARKIELLTDMTLMATMRNKNHCKSRQRTRHISLKLTKASKWLRLLILIHFMIVT